MRNATRAWLARRTAPLAALQMRGVERFDKHREQPGAQSTDGGLEAMELKASLARLARALETVVAALRRPPTHTQFRYPLVLPLAAPEVRQHSEASAQRSAEPDPEGYDSDEHPHGFGEFGWSATNPVPCDSIMGSFEYLASLCAPDGTPVTYERRGSTSSQNIPKPIDVYSLRHHSGRSLGLIYISAYQKRNSSRTPVGLLLRP